MSPKALADLSSLLNPILLVVLAGFALKRRPPGWQFLSFIGASAVALLLTFTLAHLNRWMHLWESHLYFPSGHTAFLASVLTSIFLLDRRSVLFTVPIALAYGVLLVVMQWHTWLDGIGALLFAPPVTWLCHSMLPSDRPRKIEESDRV